MYIDLPSIEPSLRTLSRKNALRRAIDLNNIDIDILFYSDLLLPIHAYYKVIN